MCLTIVVMILNCSTVSMKKSAKFDLDVLQDWPNLYKNNYRQLHTLKSEARISVESPEFATSFNVDVVYGSPDTLFIQAEGPFGIDVGKIFIGGERFIIYNQFNNQFLSGSLDDEYYNTFLESGLTFREIKNGFIGFTPLPEDLILDDKIKGIFLASAEGKKWRYSIDVEKGTLKTFEVIEDGQVTFKEEFMNYTEIEGIIFPRFIRLILPKKNEMVAIYHKNIKINEPVDKNIYSIEIGPKTRQLNINE